MFVKATAGIEIKTYLIIIIPHRHYQYQGHNQTRHLPGLIHRSDIKKICPVSIPIENNPKKTFSLRIHLITFRFRRPMPGVYIKREFILWGYSIRFVQGSKTKRDDSRCGYNGIYLKKNHFVISYREQRLCLNCI